jgi:tetratricopeptide (TPR) repeat protein
MHRLGPLLMLGDIDGAWTALEAASRVADELRQPPHLWDVGGAHAMLALATGPAGEAEVLIERALELAEHVQPEMVVPVYRLQRYALSDFRGTLEEVEDGIRDLVAARPARPVFRCVLAHLHARLGRRREAERAFAAMAAEDFGTLPFDQEWLYGMSLLAETAALLGDADSSATLYELLSPWEALAVVDQCEGIRGPLARYLGLLATATGHADEAERHFEDALAMNARMRARPWLALTEHDYARMLVDRDAPGDRAHARELADRALAAYRQLGMDGYAASASVLAHEDRAGA